MAKGRDTVRTVSDEPTTPDEEELAAAFRAVWPDGTDWAHVVRNDVVWAAFSQPLAALVAPDFAYEDNVLPDHAGETYRGVDGLRRASLAFVEPYDEMVYDVERVVGSGDRFVSIHRVRSRARHTGIVQEFQFAYIWDYRGGRLVRCRGFSDADEALEAAGQQEQSRGNNARA